MSADIRVLAEELIAWLEEAKAVKGKKRRFGGGGGGSKHNPFRNRAKIGPTQTSGAQYPRRFRAKNYWSCGCKGGRCTCKGQEGETKVVKYRAGKRDYDKAYKAWRASTEAEHGSLENFVSKWKKTWNPKRPAKSKVGPDPSRVVGMRRRTMGWD